MTDTSDIVEDPWAWLHEEHADDDAAVHSQTVTLVLISSDNEGPDQRTAEALVRLSVNPESVLPVAANSLSDQTRAIAEESDSDWLWFLRDGAVPAPHSLESLLRTGLADPPADLVGPLHVQPRRRGHGVLIEKFGQTLTTAGRPATLAVNGEPFQGQLGTTEVLGLSLDGLLIRRERFLALGGLVGRGPLSQRGLELGWRANLAGQRVVAEPTAHLAPAQDQRDEAAERRWGLALAATHSPRGALFTRLRLIVGALASTVGFLLGKDPARARAELAGLVGWLRQRDDARELRTAVKQVTVAPRAAHRIAALRPGLREAATAALDGAAGRFADWVATFTDREEQVNLDDLIGDDYASQTSGLRRLSPVMIGGLLVGILALVAGRTLFGLGSLSASQLLPAQATWGALVDDYLRPIAGQPGVAAPAWLGLTSLFAAPTFGNVDVLVALVFGLAVPTAWFATFRLLRRIVEDGRVALVGGFLYALAPALVGGLNRGMFGLVLWAALLPMLGYCVLDWFGGGIHSWRQAGLAGLLTLLCTAVEPPTWPIVIVLAAVAAVRTRTARGILQLGLVMLAPAVLLLGPQWTSWAAFPGRALTGTDPALASTAAAQPWLLALGQAPGGGVPPLWLAAVVVGTAWLAALVGALRRPAAGWLVLAAAGCLAAAVGFGLIVVEVSPGALVRPTPEPWLVAMLAALTVAAAVGLDGLGAELSARNLGLAHLASLALSVLVLIASVLAVGWWAWSGQTGITRGSVGELPPFIRLAQLEGATSRTLAIENRDSSITWALVEDDLPRLGDAERGIAYGGLASATTLAQDVVARLVNGSADDQLVGDLRRLGVGHVWASGFDSAARTAISNTPGLGTGTGDDQSASWPVPGSGRAVLVDGPTRTPVGQGSMVAVGGPARTLELAEPADPRWRATLNGQPLALAPSDDGRQVFQLGASGGQLQLWLDRGDQRWLWLQLLAFGLLVLLALPGLRTGAAGSAPRRGLRAAP